MKAVWKVADTQVRPAGRPPGGCISCVAQAAAEQAVAARLEEMIGLRRVFDALCAAKKPVGPRSPPSEVRTCSGRTTQFVIHNGLSDIAHLFNAFFYPLPGACLLPTCSAQRSRARLANCLPRVRE